MTQDELVEKWGPLSRRCNRVATRLRKTTEMDADLTALLATAREEEREQFKAIFIWRDRKPYYCTRYSMPMEIPERIIKRIKAAVIRRGRR